MNSIDRLLKLDIAPLHVYASRQYIHVKYAGSEVIKGMFLTTEFGEGLDFQSACDDYLNKISGKTLVFNAYCENRKEVNVL